MEGRAMVEQDRGLVSIWASWRLARGSSLIPMFHFDGNRLCVPRFVHAPSRKKKKTKSLADVHARFLATLGNYFEIEGLDFIAGIIDKICSFCWRSRRKFLRKIEVKRGEEIYIFIFQEKKNLIFDTNFWNVYFYKSEKCVEKGSGFA